MLKSLSITNYALIDQLDIQFDAGFSTITGETGAGKSILLGALSLILGNRADLSVLKNKEAKCVIEGSFDIKKLKLQAYFKEKLPDIDYEDETILRRIITTNGKSRAFVNDSPINLTSLKDLGVLLIDIHSQHKNLLLSDNKFQLKVVDSMAKNEKLLLAYAEEFKIYKKIQIELNSFIEKSEIEKKDADYFQHRFEQLQEANLSENEQEELEQELETMNNTEEIKSSLGTAFASLSSDEFSVIQNLITAKDSLGKITSVYSKSNEYYERLNSSLIEIQDIASEVEVSLEDIEFSPERMEFINARLNDIYTLQQTHRVKSVNELLEIQSDLEKKLDDIHNFDFEIEALRKKQALQKEKLENAANKISRKRKEIIPNIEQSIVKELNSLGMPSAVFQISVEKEKEFTPSGMDKITYLFSANKAGDLNEIEKVASGGEIARVMISIKALVSSSLALPTIIFDEVDTGVSGDIADKMGNIMRKMSKNMQVMSITHLPQIAAKGSKHYLVYKQDTADTTISNIKELSEKERITEIAKMLSGKKLTNAAIENAKTLLQLA